MLPVVFYYVFTAVLGMVFLVAVGINNGSSEDTDLVGVTTMKIEDMPEIDFDIEALEAEYMEDDSFSRLLKETRELENA